MENDFEEIQNSLNELIQVGSQMLHELNEQYYLMQTLLDDALQDYLDEAHKTSYSFNDETRYAYKGQNEVDYAMNVRTINARCWPKIVMLITDIRITLRKIEEMSINLDLTHEQFEIYKKLNDTLVKFEEDMTE